MTKACRHRSGAESAHLGRRPDVEGTFAPQTTQGHGLNSARQFPILKSTHHLLPSPDGELAPAIEAILDIYGTNVTVLVAHNGQGRYLFICVTVVCEGDSFGRLADDVLCRGDPAGPRVASHGTCAYNGCVVPQSSHLSRLRRHEAQGSPP